MCGVRRAGRLRAARPARARRRAYFVSRRRARRPFGLAPSPAGLSRMSQPLRPPSAAPRRIVPPGGGIPAIALLALTLAMGVVATAGAQPRRDSVRTVQPVVITGARTAATIGGA